MLFLTKYYSKEDLLLETTSLRWNKKYSDYLNSLPPKCTPIQILLFTVFKCFSIAIAFVFEQLRRNHGLEDWVIAFSVFKYLNSIKAKPWVWLKCFLFWTLTRGERSYRNKHILTLCIYWEWSSACTWWTWVSWRKTAALHSCGAAPCHGPLTLEFQPV